MKTNTESQMDLLTFNRVSEKVIDLWLGEGQPINYYDAPFDNQLSGYGKTSLRGSTYGHCLVPIGKQEFGQLVPPQLE